MSGRRGGVGRRVFLRAAGAGAAAVAVFRLPVGLAAGPEDDIVEASLADLQQRMASGQLTARALTEAYLERIDALDRRGPELRSVIETNPDALAIADALDGERQAKGARGPLHGIPVLIKDNIDTADRMATTAGSLALEGSSAPRDAFIVERLRAAGAILGKTNLQRVGQLPLDALVERLERARRPVPQPLRARPQPLRLELRARARPSRPTSCAVGGRHRDRRLDRLPVVGHAASSASSRRSAWSAAPASSPSRTARTPPGRWRAPSPTRRSLLGALAGVDPRDAATAASRGRARGRLHAVPRRRRPARRAHRRRAQALRLQRPTSTRLMDEAHRRDEAARAR